MDQLTARLVATTMSESADLALISLFSILEVVCLIFNVLVCVVLYRSKSLTIPMNYLIFNLAISDILIGMFIFPRHVIFSKPAFQHPTDTTGDYFCKFNTGSGILWTSSTASGFILIAIAVERYTSIMIQHRSSPFTSSRINGVVVFCWVSALAANLPTLIVFAYDEEKDFCMENWPGWVNPKAYVMCIFFLGSSSVIVMYVLYSQVIYTLWNRQRRATEISQAARLRARKNITKLLVLVTFVHTVCRLPNYTTYLLVYYAPDVKYGSNTYNITVLLILLNSALHPFMLCWKMQGLRKPLFVLFCCCRANRVFVEPEPFHVSTHEARLSVFHARTQEQSRAQSAS